MDKKHDKATAYKTTKDMKNPNQTASKYQSECSTDFGAERHIQNGKSKNANTMQNKDK